MMLVGVSALRKRSEPAFHFFEKPVPPLHSILQKEVVEKVKCEQDRQSHHDEGGIDAEILSWSLQYCFMLIPNRLFFISIPPFKISFIP